MRYSIIAGQCLLLIAAAGSAAAFNLGSRGPLSSPSLSPSPSECLVFTGRPSSWSRTKLLFVSPKPSDEELEQRKEQLRILLSATDKEIEKLVRNNPTVLKRRDIVGAYGPKLKLIEERLGISKKEARQLCLVANRVLNVSLKTLESKIDWFQARLNLNKVQLRRIIERSPVILALSVDDNLEPTLDSIQSSLELSDKELTKIVWKTPDVLQNNFSSEKLAVRLSFLRDLLSIKEGDIAKLRKAVLKRPEILFWSEESMLESQQWIKNRFGYGDSKVAQICRSFLDPLVSNITTLEERANDIQSELALDDDELKRMISSTAKVLATSVDENIKPKMEYFQRTFALDAEEAKSLVLRHPILFTLSIEKNIEAKLEFYSELAGKAVAKEAIIENPNLLLQSLKKRLKPRLAEVEEQGGKVRWTKTFLFRMALRNPAQWEAYGLDDAPRGRGARSRKE